MEENNLNQDTDSISGSPEQIPAVTPPPSAKKPNFLKIVIKVLLVIIGLILIYVLSNVVIVALGLSPSQKPLSIPSKSSTDIITTPLPTGGSPATLKYLTVADDLQFSEKYFTIEYPSNWILAEKSSYLGALLQTDNATGIDFGKDEVGNGAFISTQTLSKDGFFSFDELVNQRISPMQGKLIENKNFTLDGVPAKILVLNRGAIDVMQVIYHYPFLDTGRVVSHNSMEAVSEIKLVSAAKSFSSNRSDFEKMLSTLKFFTNNNRFACEGNKDCPNGYKCVLTGPKIVSTPNAGRGYSYCVTNQQSGGFQPFDATDQK